jgi:predicted Rossmann fold flavoprotein
VTVTPLYPALTPICIENFTKSLKGIRAAGKITLKSAGKVIAEAAGEIQYTDYGLSGIPAMQVSRFAAERLAEGNEVLAFVDSAPDIPAEELTQRLLALKQAHPAMTAEDLLAGLLPKRLGTVLIASCSLSPAKEIGGLHDNAVSKIVSAVKRTKYKVSAVRGFADAQVTAGGLDVTEFTDALESKRVPGLFACGEIWNIDGKGGGYNLAFAWSSGRLAGRSAAQLLQKYKG